jgi:hypothetical protein
LYEREKERMGRLAFLEENVKMMNRKEGEEKWPNGMAEKMAKWNEWPMEWPAQEERKIT